MQNQSNTQVRMPTANRPPLSRKQTKISLGNIPSLKNNLRRSPLLRRVLPYAAPPCDGSATLRPWRCDQTEPAAAPASSPGRLLSPWPTLPRTAPFRSRRLGNRGVLGGHFEFDREGKSHTRRGGGGIPVSATARQDLPHTTVGTLRKKDFPTSGPHR